MEIGARTRSGKGVFLTTFRWRRKYWILPCNKEEIKGRNYWDEIGLETSCRAWEQAFKSMASFRRETKVKSFQFGLAFSSPPPYSRQPQKLCLNQDLLAWGGRIKQLSHKSWESEPDFKNSATLWDDLASLGKGIFFNACILFFVQIFPCFL